MLKNFLNYAVAPLAILLGYSQFSEAKVPVAIAKSIGEMREQQERNAQENINQITNELEEILNTSTFSLTSQEKVDFYRTALQTLREAEEAGLWHPNLGSLTEVYQDNLTANIAWLAFSERRTTMLDALRMYADVRSNCAFSVVLVPEFERIINEYQQKCDKTLVKIGGELDKNKLHRAVREIDIAILEGLDEFAQIIEGKSRFAEYKQVLIDDALQKGSFDAVYLEGLFLSPVERVKYLVEQKNWKLAEEAVREVRMVYGFSDDIFQKWSNYLQLEQEFANAYQRYEAAVESLIKQEEHELKYNWRNAARELRAADYQLSKSADHLGHAIALSEDIPAIFKNKVNRIRELEHRVDNLSAVAATAFVEQNIRDVYESSSTNFLGEQKNREAEYETWKQQVGRLNFREERAVLEYGAQVRENSVIRAVQNELLTAESQMQRGLEKSAHYHALLGVLNNQEVRTVYEHLCRDLNLDVDPLVHPRRKWKALEALREEGHPALVGLHQRVMNFKDNANPEYEAEVRARTNRENAFNDTLGLIARPLYYVQTTVGHLLLAGWHGANSALTVRAPNEPATTQFGREYGLHAEQAVLEASGAGKDLVNAVRSTIALPSAATNLVRLPLKQVEDVSYVGPVLRTLEQNTLGGEYFNRSFSGFKGRLLGPYDSFKLQQHEEGSLNAWFGLGVQAGTLYGLVELWPERSRNNHPADQNQNNQGGGLSGGNTGGTHIFTK